MKTRRSTDVCVALILYSLFYIYLFWFLLRCIAASFILHTLFFSIYSSYSLALGLAVCVLKQKNRVHKTISTYLIATFSFSTGFIGFFCFLYRRFFASFLHGIDCHTYLFSTILYTRSVWFCILFIRGAYCCHF